MILAPFFSRPPSPTGSHRVILGHVRSHDQDRIGIGQVLLRRGGAAAPKRCAQTGHGGAVSYTGLVADANHAQASGEKFLDQVVFFVVERRAAEVGESQWSASGSGRLLIRRRYSPGSRQTRSAIMSMARLQVESSHFRRTDGGISPS